MTPFRWNFRGQRGQGLSCPAFVTPPPAKIFFFFLLSLYLADLRCALVRPSTPGRVTEEGPAVGSSPKRSTIITLFAIIKSSAGGRSSTICGAGSVHGCLESHTNAYHKILYNWRMSSPEFV